MTIKQMVMRLVLIGEMGIFTYLYVYGKNGLQLLQVQKQQLQELRSTVERLECEINSLENDIVVWESDDFYKEKIAREQLQMARKGDKLFYVGS